MGSPAAFPESNAVWKGWPEAVGRPEVLDLPSYRQGAETITCWQFTPEEIVEIISTGHVWLHVVGQQPPVYVGGTTPFPDSTKEAVRGIVQVP